MSNTNFSNNAISHKELNEFLIKAKKEVSLSDSLQNINIEKKKEFNDLVKNWTETSQKILLMMNMKEKVFTDTKNPKSLMAFGAMGAHINMALQALKATEYEQWSLNVSKLLHK